MKRNLIISLCAAFAALALCSCGGKNGPVATETPLPARRIYSVKQYNKTGKVQREDFYGSDRFGENRIVSTVNYSYNDSGRLLSAKRTTVGDDFAKIVENYTYSGQNWTQYIKYDDFGSASEVYTRTYYASGAIKSEQKSVSFREGMNLSKCDETRFFAEDGTLESVETVEGNVYTRREYIYDEETGLLTEEDVFNSNSGKKNDYMLFDVVKHYYYEETDLLERSVETGLSGDVTLVTVHEYDEAGRETYRGEYSSEETDEEHFKGSAIFEYDAAGNTVLSAEMNRDGSGWKTSFEYDAAGKVIYEATVTFYGDDETRTVTTETQYDVHGNPVRSVEKNFDGKVTVRTWSYEYYDSGSLKTVTRYEDE